MDFEWTSCCKYMRYQLHAHGVAHTSYCCLSVRYAGRCPKTRLRTSFGAAPRVVVREAGRLPPSASAFE